MNSKIITKSKITEFLDVLINQNYTVFAPVKSNGIISFEQIQSGDEALLNFYNSKKVPKEIFFPQKEVMFSYVQGETGMEIVDVPFLQSKNVLFGVRPCDAKGFTLLDKVFNEEDYSDSYYLQRRENTTIIGLACNHPQNTCFCTSFDRGPFEKVDSDLFFVDMGDRYLVEIVTEKGKELIKGEQFEEAEKDELEIRRQLSENAEASISSKVNVDVVKEKLDDMFESPFWDEVHQKCIGCATCTYLCSTCHCFDILDETKDVGGERIRIWDSCMFSLFTLHASGHNPRPSTKERVKQRIMHKFNFFVENYDEIACVGCGRCVRNCPVNLDIRQIINMIGERTHVSTP